MSIRAKIFLVGSLMLSGCNGYNSNIEFNDVSKHGYSQIQITSDRDKSIDIFTDVQLNDFLTLQVGLDTGAGFNVFRFNSRYMNTLGLDSSAMKSREWLFMSCDSCYREKLTQWNYTV